MITVFFEIDRPPLRVGDAAIIEHLQQNVEYIRMRLFDFVEEDDRIRLPADRLRQLAAFFITNVTGRSTDQPRNTVLLHVLGNFEAHYTRSSRPGPRFRPEFAR